MQVVCDMICELPFVLNLPSGTYQAPAGGTLFELEIQQEVIALHLPDGSFAIDTEDRLRAEFGAKYDDYHKQPLRTLMRHRTQYSVPDHELPTPTAQQLHDEMMSSILRESPRAFNHDQTGLRAEADRRLENLDAVGREDFRKAVARKLRTKVVPDKDAFLTAVNGLIRLYMQRFNDFFVEEVAVHQLASQTPLRGVYVLVMCDQQVVHNYGIVELAPPMMRRPWFKHPQEAIDAFQHDLANGIDPDAVALLAIRAKAFLQRGAYRSAIVEASAALDLALTRKIREGLTKLGYAFQDVESLLRQPANQRFGERAKTLLKQSTGVSAAQLDPLLWQRVTAHRKTNRQGVAHADQEPVREEAEQVVADFTELARLLGRIIPEIDIQQRAYCKWVLGGGGHGHDIDDWLEAEQELLSERGP